MPFQTDETWTPERYRHAYAVWQDNAPANDGPIMPRDAHTASPRHGKLSAKLRSLLTWKAATNPDPALATSWMRYDLHADNDNDFDEHCEPVPQLLDSEIEVRPSINELRLGYEPKVWNKEDVEYHRGVAVGGDMAHGVQKGVPEYAASKIEGDKAPLRDCRIVKRIRGLEFSNGEQTERVLVKAGKNKVAYDDVRMPAGALVRYKTGKTWRRPSDEFREAKGALPEAEATVGVGGHNTGSLPCPDPVVDHEWAATLRGDVDEETAHVLDLAVSAANFREVGEAFGKYGKHAERVGKTAVLEACARLDEVLSDNDNGWKATARLEDLAA